MNFDLSAAEIREKRQLVNSYKVEREGLDERINELIALSDEATDETIKAELIKTLAELAQQRAELEQKLDATAVSIAPIRKLPPELLSMILVVNLRENYAQPWAALAVSRAWRTVGLETPRLWNHIWTVEKNNARRNPTSIENINTDPPGGIICYNAHTFSIALQRSEAVPLEMYIEYAGTLSNNPAYCRKVFNTSAPRWKSVLLLAYDTYQPQPVAFPLSTLSFPNLESVDIHPLCTTDLMLMEAVTEGLDSSAPKLRTLESRSVAVWDTLTARHSLLRKLHNLYLLIPWHSRQLSSVPWHAFSNLKTFSLLDEAGRVRIPARANHMESLTSFAASTPHLLQITADLCRLRSLTHVCLRNYNHYAGSRFAAFAISEDEIPEPFSVELPRVTHFTLVSPTYEAIGCFRLPSLAVLELFGGNKTAVGTANDELETIWQPGTFGQAPSPSVALHLETQANDAYVLTTLRGMENIQELHLYYNSGAYTHQTLLKSLAKKPNKSMLNRGPEALKKWSPPICPELRRLQLLYRKLSPIEKGGVLQKLGEVKQARLGTAREIEHLDAVATNGRYLSSNEAYARLRSDV